MFVDRDTINKEQTLLVKKNSLEYSCKYQHVMHFLTPSTFLIFGIGAKRITAAELGTVQA